MYTLNEYVEILDFSKLTTIVIIFSSQTTHFCLWNDNYTAQSVTLGLPSFLIFRCSRYLWLKGFSQTPCFALCNILLYLVKVLENTHHPLSDIGYHWREQEKKAGAKSEKVKWLNCIIQPFARQCFHATSSLQLLAANDSNFFFL